MGSIKETDIKTHAYYFFNDMNNIKNFDPNRIKIDKKSYMNINIYYIGYITIKYFSYTKIISENLLFFATDKTDG